MKRIKRLVPIEVRELQRIGEERNARIDGLLAEITLLAKQLKDSEARRVALSLALTDAHRQGFGRTKDGD